MEKSEVNVLSNIPGSPKIVSKSPDVSKLSATRRQIYDKVRSMRESPINDNTVLSQPRKFFGETGQGEQIDRRTTEKYYCVRCFRKEQSDI